MGNDCVERFVHSLSSIRKDIAISNNPSGQLILISFVLYIT